MADQKKVFVFGHHIKAQEVEYSAFSTLTRGSLANVFKKYKNWKINDKDEIVCYALYSHGDEVVMSFPKSEHINATFNQFCSLISRAGAKLSLANNEVCFQYPTTSVIGYRFKTCEEALGFFNWLTDNKFEVTFSESKYKHSIGDRVKLNTDVVFELDFPFGLVTGFNTFKIAAGEEVEIFDIDDTTFVMKPLIGKHVLEIGPANWHGIVNSADVLYKLSLEIIADN